MDINEQGKNMSDEAAPLFPAGEFVPPGDYDDEQKAKYVGLLKAAPDRVAAAVKTLNDAQLDTLYRNWTIRQIVHHLADSHVNAYVRYKWALTEESPLIKAYNETLWSETPDSKTAPIDDSLSILVGLHSRWANLITHLDEQQFQRDYFHPEIGNVVSLAEALPSYVWHTDHHVAQIEWVKANRDWK